MKSKNFDINKIIKDFDNLDPEFIYPQGTSFEEIHKTLINRGGQIILECGVRKGFSTSIFTYHSEKNNGHCFSVDIEDCSDVVISEHWSFIQSDDRDVKKILNKFKLLDEKGIDILFIDSLHTAKHLKQVLYSWYPYLNKNSIIFIDDIDSFPYHKNQPKNSLMNNINWDEMNKFTIDFSRSNKNDVTLVQIYKKSGLAKLYKNSEKGSLPNKIQSKDRSYILIKFIKVLRSIRNVIKN